MLWLIDQDVALEMRRYVSAGMLPSADKSAEYIAKCDAEALDTPRSYTQAGDTAEIRVEGVLTPRPSLFAMIFGGGNTTYADLQAAIGRAESEPSVKRVVFQVNSPGGTVEGLFDTLAAIEGMRKPRTVVASFAASAAYAIAASVGKIRASAPAATFGSIGVVATYLVFEDEVSVTSTDAPDKRPDVRTEDGQAVVRKYLDEIHALFVDAIARGRGVTVNRVNTDFGRGSVMLAKSARAAGMIDTIAAPGGARAEHDVNTEADVDVEPETQVNAAAAATKQGKNMTAEELKAKHPEVYNAIHAEGKKAGEAAERDRCVAHLNMGFTAESQEPAGAIKTAVEAVKTGTDMTLTVMSEYMSATKNRVDRQSAQMDSDAAGTVVAGAEAPAAEVTDIGDLVAARFDVAKGVAAKA